MIPLSKLTASAPQMSSPSTEERWGPAAGPPPGSCSAPESDGSAYSKGTVQPGPLCPRLLTSLHLQSQCCLSRWRKKKKTHTHQIPPNKSRTNVKLVVQLGSEMLI